MPKKLIALILTAVMTSHVITPVISYGETSESTGLSAADSVTSSSAVCPAEDAVVEESGEITAGTGEIVSADISSSEEVILSDDSLPDTYVSGSDDIIPIIGGVLFNDIITWNIEEEYSMGTETNGLYFGDDFYCSDGELNGSFEYDDEYYDISGCYLMPEDNPKGSDGLSPWNTNGLCEGIPYSGGYLSFSSGHDGIFTIAVRTHMGKETYVVDEDSNVLCYVNNLDSEDYKYNILRFYVTAGKTYYIYADNSKIRLFYIGFSYTAGEGNSITLKIADEENNIISEGYTVNWYEDGDYIGSGNNIYTADETGEITYRIVLDDDLSLIYYAPEKQLAEYDGSQSLEITYTLQSISSLTVKGKITDSEGTAVSGANVTFVQNINGNTNEINTSSDSSGSFTAEILNVPTNVVITADGYYRSSTTVIESTAESDINIGTTALTALPKNKLSLSLYCVSAAESGETGSTTSLGNANGIEFSVYNETLQKEVQDITVQYPYIIWGDSSVNAGDVITVTASDSTDSMTAEPVTVTLDEQKMGSASIIFTQNGYIKASAFGSFTKVALIFNSSGEYISKQFFIGQSYSSAPLPEGNYSAAFIKKTDMLTSVSNLSKFDEIGLSAGTDYILKNISVSNGIISDAGILTVPDFDETKLYYTVSDYTSFASNCSSTSLGKYITFKAQYKIDSKYESSEEKITVEIPEGMELITGSVILDGNTAAYSYNNSTLSIQVNKDEAIVYFYCVASKKGSYDVNALLSFENNGEIVQPIGTASLEADAFAINVPSETSYKDITVTGTALPKSTVTVYENGTAAGTVKANSVGSWSAQIALTHTYSYTFHDIYAEIENSQYTGTIKTDTETVLYNSEYLNVSKVTMYNTGDNGLNTTVFDFLNPGTAGSYRMWPGVYTSFTFVIEFEGDISRVEDVVLNVFVKSGNVYSYNAEYDETREAYVVNAQFTTFNDAPVNVGVDYTCENSEDFEYSATAHEDAEANNALFIEEFNNVIEGLMSAEITEESDDQLVLRCYLEEYDDCEWDIVINELDYSSFDIDSLTDNGFELCEADNSYEKPQYLNISVTDDNLEYIIVDEEYEYAYKYDISLDYISLNSAVEEVLSDADLSSYIFNDLTVSGDLSYENMNGLQRGLWDVAENLPAISGLPAAIDYNNLLKLLENKDNEINRLFEDTVDILSAKCSDTGELRLSDGDYETMYSRYQSLLSNREYIYIACSGQLDLYFTKIMNSAAFEVLTACIGDVLGKTGRVMRVLKNSKNAKYTKYIFRSQKTRNRAGLIASGSFDAVTSLSGYINNAANEFFNTFDSTGSQYWFYIKSEYDDLKLAINTLNSEIMSKYQKCGDDDDPDEPGVEEPSKSPDMDKTPILDPSGYVYEAVPSNRIEGVTATLYYSGDVLNDYGIPTGATTAYLWDGEDYDQVNPLITDSQGAYSWDVPEGSWQVKYEKSGYTTAYSEWLPVPPPQFDINQAMVSTTAPSVESVNIYENEVQVIFSEYMKLSAGDSISVSVDGETVSGTVTASNAEYNGDETEQYASIFVFTPDENILGEVTVNIAEAEGYNGLKSGAYSAAKTTAVKPQYINSAESIDVKYNSGALLEVEILPHEAADGLIIEAVSDSEEIASVTNSSVEFDESGTANIMLNGVFLGQTNLTLSIPGTDLSKSVMVNVVSETEESVKCEKVTASIASGSTVESGTELVLSTETEGAEIYYTLDGTCPCTVDSESRLLYTGPLTLTEDTFIIAYAVKDGYEDSNTAGFIYTVNASASETPTEVTTEFVSPPAFGVAGVFGGRNVTFTSESDGAVIYYSSTSSTLTTDDISVSNGETVLFEDFYGTIYARAYLNGSWSNVSRLILKIPVVNTPTVTASGSTVTVKSTTPSSFICYTTDGTEPVIEPDGTVTNGTWLRVNGARTNSGTISASPGNTVRAVAVRNCFTTSSSAAVYVAVSPAAFTVVGTFGGRNVTFNSDTSGAKIYYSSTTSSLTTSDKCVSNGETVLFEDFYGTIYARAYYNGKWSNVSRLILKIPTINTPTITYADGKATIRTTTPNCYIYYTTDGTTPSVNNGTKLTAKSYGQVSLTKGKTIKAIAVRSCFTNSEIVSYTAS